MRRALKQLPIQPFQTPALDRDIVPSSVHDPSAAVFAEVALLRPARGRVAVRVDCQGIPIRAP